MGLSLLAFLLMASYSLARPATESLFLEAHGSESLPFVWILVAAGVAAVVIFYNRFATRVELVRLFAAATLLSAALVVLLQLLRFLHVPGIYYALYLWKDIYIVVLVEIYYTFANAVFPIKTARWVYGLFGFLGSLGGVTGNLLVGVMARAWGTAVALWAVPLILLLVLLFSLYFARFGLRQPARDKENEVINFRQALGVVRRSSYLTLVLILIALVQIVVTLVDYSFNSLIKLHFPLMDQRTALIGQVYAVISGATLLLHALTGPILRLSGIPLTLLAIPLLLACGVGSFLLWPGLMLIMALKVASKSFDYTLFRSAKEILYIPLSYQEKTAGKAVVDMMTYRVAKGGASLLLLLLLALHLAWLATGWTFAFVLLWGALTVVVVRRFRQKVSREQEMSRHHENKP